MTKVNIDTDGRLVWTRVHREFFRDKPEKFDLRDPGKVFMAEYANFIAHKNEKLGSAGQARRGPAPAGRLDCRRGRRPPPRRAPQLALVGRRVDWLTS